MLHDTFQHTATHSPAIAIPNAQHFSCRLQTAVLLLSNWCHKTFDVDVTDWITQLSKCERIVATRKVVDYRQTREDARVKRTETGGLITACSLV